MDTPESSRKVLKPGSYNGGIVPYHFMYETLKLPTMESDIICAHFSFIRFDGPLLLLLINKPIDGHTEVHATVRVSRTRFLKLRPSRSSRVGR